MKQGFLLSTNDNKNKDLGPLQDSRSRGVAFKWAGVGGKRNDNPWGTVSSGTGDWSSTSSTNGGDAGAGWTTSNTTSSNKSSISGVWTSTNTDSSTSKNGWGQLISSSSLLDDFRKDAQSFVSKQTPRPEPIAKPIITNQQSNYRTSHPMVLESSTTTDMIDDEMITTTTTVTTTTKTTRTTRTHPLPPSSIPSLSSLSSPPKPLSTTPTTTKPPPSTNPPNPYINMPNLPNKTMGVPKNALSAYYGTRHRGQPLPNTQFTSHNDNGPPHILRWTSVFTCPLTKETFTSGRYGSEKNWIMKGEVVWYKKKILAEHAAAARALDCFLWRETKGGPSEGWRLCQEEPYGEIMVVDKEDMGEDKGEERVVEMSEGEMEEEMLREAYRRSRLGC